MDPMGYRSYRAVLPGHLQFPCILGRQVHLATGLQEFDETKLFFRGRMQRLTFFKQCGNTPEEKT